jgi:molybdenum cofactor cytidylyltransferase
MMARPDPPPVIGLLLAAGRGRRFAASLAGGANEGVDRNKLLARLPDDIPVAAASAQKLLAVVPKVLAVVRTDGDALASALRQAGCDIVVCEQADLGMGASLACGARALLAQAAVPGFDSCIVALADMPWLSLATLDALLAQLARHAIVAPSFQGIRGHPVGFQRALWPELAALAGDRGAQDILKRHGVATWECGDAAILRDVDTVQDLRRG